MQQHLLYNLPLGFQYVTQYLCVTFFAWMLWKDRNYKNLLNTTLIFLWFPRIFDFYGKNVQDFYKLGTLFLVLACYMRYRAYRVHRQTGDALLTIAFVIFSAIFFASVVIVGNDTFTTIFSQYSRYAETYLMFFVLKEAIFVRGQRETLLRLLMQIISIQIVLAVVRYAIFPHPIESMVGTLVVASGGQATMLPIIGFVVLWIYRRGDLQRLDWLYVFGLLFTGFASGKRAVIAILPLVVAMFLVYVKGIRISKYMVVTVAAVPLLLYAGIRLTPSLNPENKVWGSFDWEYAWNYAEQYQFGREGLEGQRDALFATEQMNMQNGVFRAGNKITAEGRGGATVALFKLFFGSHSISSQDWWGMGYTNMYGVDYAMFDKLPLTIRINHKGSATGLFQSYVTSGIAGILATILFCFLPFCLCHDRRYRVALLLIAMYDYFMYSGLLFRTPAFMVAVVFAILYINSGGMQQSMPIVRTNPFRLLFSKSTARL